MQSNIQPKLPITLDCPQPKTTIGKAIEKFVNPSNPPVSPYKSQTQTITNKLMVSTSSGNNTEQTNFINVETEPFSNPLQVESTENEKQSPKNSSLNSNNNDLASQMEKLEVSKVSQDLFSQFSSSSKFSLPPNRMLSNKKNIENISQRISNIHMADHDDDELADTQPNTSSQKLSKSQVKDALADTQPNSSPIVLSSDDEGDQEENNENNNNNSLMTEESEDDDSVIILTDSSLEITEDPVPKDISAINTQTEEITESVQAKLNHFFDNIPKLSVSHDNNYSKIVDPENESVCSEINISETIASKSDIENPDESNVSEIQASQLHENIDRNASQIHPDRSASQIKLIDNQKNETMNSSSSKANATSLHRSCVNESGKTSTVDNELSDDPSVHSDNDNMGSPKSSLHQNQSTDQKQMSVHEPTKKIEFENIKSSGKNLITVNSPIINISAKVNINIRLSVCSGSTTSSDTDGVSENTDGVSENADGVSENADEPSEESSKNNGSILSEAIINSSGERRVHCRKESSNTSHSNLVKYYVGSPNHQNKISDDDNIDAQNDNIGVSPESSVIESSVVSSHANDIEDIAYEEKNISGICDSVDVAKQSTISDTSTSKQDKNNISVLPIDSSVEIDEIDEQILNEIYGDTWRTPQLIKKCLSTKKKCLTEVPRRNLSRGFSLCEYASIECASNSTIIQIFVIS